MEQELLTLQEHHERMDILMFQQYPELGFYFAEEGLPF
jgi:hypothetical protein